MSTPTKTLHGSRMLAFGPNSTKALGQFESVSSGAQYGNFVPFVLGRVSGGEIVLTDMAPVSVRLSGFRKVNEGPYSVDIGMTMLQDFFRDDKEFTFLLQDRVTGEIICAVVQSKIVGHNFDVAARSPMRLQLDVIGLRFYDEEGEQDEPIGSVTY